ncbi:hypothetical protein DFH07DRAFT_1010785 [Mycena maculata]|uniref:Uncharacterized protein n=1 Tax=Mycena maculata TaxID=230809 RepID=A0AAD7KBU2_9AGAR|nr:hypothetical protein DFH07DRAFT_1010785 [Mycena maculata]
MFVSNLVPSVASILLVSDFLVNAAPCRPPPPASKLTAADLIQMGALANCSAETQFPAECRTAAQAAPFVNQGFNKYNITTVGEKAALLSLMLFESGGFAFDINHSLNTPGQGTRAELTFPFILEYALDTPSVAAQARALAGANATDPAAVPADTENAIRALVLPDALSFASAMWFYKQSGAAKTGCTATPGMIAGLQRATLPGWESYITDCVGTTVTDARQAIYEQTLAVFLAQTAAAS